MHTDSGQVALVGAVAFVGAALLVPVIRRVALRYGIADHPGRGKLNTVVTPTLGGVGILLVALAACVLLPQWTAKGAAILLGAAVVGGVGLVDDVRTLGPAPRLAVEVAAATLAFSMGARVALVGGVGDWALTVLWLVVVTNAFNLLDNMDGAAGGVGCTIAIALAIAAVVDGQFFVAGLAAVVAGACLGFLLHNWHPARIFMGDAGSLFIGFLLASIALELRFAVS